MFAADPAQQKAESLTKDSVREVRHVLEDLTYPVKTAALRDGIRQAAEPMGWAHGREGGGRYFNYWALGEAAGGHLELEFEHPYFRHEGNGRTKIPSYVRGLPSGPMLVAEPISLTSAIRTPISRKRRNG